MQAWADDLDGRKAAGKVVAVQGGRQMKTRRIDRGLFSHDVSVAETADEIKEAWQRVTVDPLPEYLARARNAALAVLKHHSLASAARTPRARQASWPGDVHMACDVLGRLQLLEGRWPKELWSDERRLLSDAMMLVQEYDELRVNLMFERDVLAREKQLAKFPDKPTVTDQQIDRALSESPTKAAAARKLGISARQLFRRLGKRARS